jgi:uncharacterized protein with HEPN domain
MPKREVIVRLEDIKQFITEIESNVAQIQTFANYTASNLYKMAFERAFELIGEALYHIRKERPDIVITDMQKIIGLRHIIAHAYYEVEHERLWVVATKYLPVLKEEVEHWINEENIRLFGTTNPNLD